MTKYRIASALLAIAVATLGVLTAAEEQPTATGAQQFEALKKLVGDWVQVGEDGKPTDQVLSSIRLTAGGSALCETIFPGTDKEMITMYHLDGSDLLLTHYCILGNQPRLRAEHGQDPHHIAFKYLNGTNLNSEKDHHMNQATFTLIDADHFQSEWASCEGGKTCHQVKLNMVRSKAQPEKKAETGKAKTATCCSR